MALFTASLYDRSADGVGAKTANGIVHVATLTGAIALDQTYPNVCKFDPGGASRNVTLDAEEGAAGLWRWLVNAADTTENLVLLNDASSPATIATVNQNESALVYCDGTSWVLVAIVAIALS